MLDIPIIYEDDEVLVINKPAGLAVHGNGFGAEEYTLANWLLEKYPHLKDVGESMIAQNGIVIAKPGLVHRLDKGTSGVMIVAKTQSAFLWLKNQFSERLAHKTYRLVVHGAVKTVAPGEEGVIDLPIGRSNRDPRLRVASPKAAGQRREAVTRFQLLKNYPNFAYLEANPVTGRTHQLRAHFKALNHPLMGDPLYAAHLPKPEGITRLMLHAFRLDVELPDGRRKVFEAPLPENFTRTLERLKTLC